LSEGGLTQQHPGKKKEKWGEVREKGYKRQKKAGILSPHLSRKRQIKNTKGENRVKRAGREKPLWRELNKVRKKLPTTLLSEGLQQKDNEKKIKDS